MEESFKARVDKVFGSLAADAQQLDSLWSLTDEEIERKEWNRDKGTSPDPHRGVLSIRLAEDVEEEEELDDDVDDDAAGTSRRLAAKPDDHDDEEWLIRSSVGMDCTLDKEEEEDEFDQIAVGIDKAGDGICMDKIDQYADSFVDVGGDSGTNHCMEGDEAIGEFEACAASERERVMVPSSKSLSRLPDDRVSVKSILKKDEKNVQHKSLKRVRFDPESGTGLEEESGGRSVKFASGSEVECRVSFPPPETDPRVPDYLRNPDKYVQYTLDSASELNDEEANRKAYMDFFNLIREKHAKDSQPAEDMSDYSKPITFMPRKRAGDDSMEISDPLKVGSHKENIKSKVVSSVVIAAADEACAMEEDETEMTPISITIPRKAQRQYRAKATLEALDD